MKFDFVIGNPPFQKTFEGERKAKRYNLWSLFVEKSMEVSNNIALVIPDGWMSSGTDIFESMRTFGIKHANVGECSKHFPGVGARFTYVILEKDYADDSTIVTDNTTTNIDIKNMSLICPNVKAWSILKKLTADSSKQGWRRGKGYHTTSHKDILSTDEGEYDVHHTNAQSFKTDVRLGDITKKKVYTTISGYYIPHYDEGSVGVTQATAVCEVGDIDNARTVFDSKLYKFIGSHIARQQGWLNLTLMKSISHVDLSRSWTDNQLYSYFDLTDEEVKYIETNI